MPNEGDHLLHFQYQGSKGLSVPAKVEYFSHLESWLDEICDRVAAGQNTRMHLQLIADEIFTNICSYAYPKQPDDGTVCFSCSFDQMDETLILVFSDGGIDFNPLIQGIRPASRRPQKGGFGLLLVRNFTDALHYERRDGRNILTLRMKICEKGATR